MAQVLKYIGRGEWLSVDESEVTANDRILEEKKIAKTRVKPTKEEKSINFFDMVKKDIQKNGYRSIKVSTFLKNFEILKRTTKNIDLVKTELKNQGLYALPEFSKELRLESTLRIYNYPVRQLGELFKSEKDLETYVEKNLLYKNLNIQSVIRQHSPSGTKDKLDFKGDCDNDEIVVLELKNAGGGKSAVEQVLRYAGLLKMEYPNRKIRQILVTGVQNYETALAIRGMLSDQRDLFEWYLYKFHKDLNHFEFVRITNKAINFESKTSKEITN